MPPQVRQAGSASPAAHARQRALHGGALAAGHAGHLAHGAVDLHHPRGIGAGLLVQAVHVLGDEGVQLAPALEDHQGAVARIGLGGPRGRLQAVLPRALPYLGIGHVVLEGGHLLGLGIARPQALGTAEVRDARLRGDARAGEDHHALSGVDELAGRVELGPLGTSSCPLAPLAPLGSPSVSARLAFGCSSPIISFSRARRGTRRGGRRRRA